MLLDATDRMVVATGVANIYGRLPSVTAMAQRLLADDSGGRFLLGLGVSHGPMVEDMLKQSWDKPLSHMRSYLDGLDDAFVVSPSPAEDPPRVLAALGPRMLELAAARAWGALTYFVPVEHTPIAREHLGEGPMLLVEQAAVLSTDPAVARDAARRHMAIYLTLPNYVNNLRRLGWDDDDLAGGGQRRPGRRAGGVGRARRDRGARRRAPRGRRRPRLRPGARRRRHCVARGAVARAGAPTRGDLSRRSSQGTDAPLVTSDRCVWEEGTAKHVVRGDAPADKLDP